MLFMEAMKSKMRLSISGYENESLNKFRAYLGIFLSKYF